jgi:hypothetical protein
VKTPGLLLFLTISGALLLRGTGYAVPPGPSSQQASAQDAANAAGDNSHGTDHDDTADTGRGVRHHENAWDEKRSGRPTPNASEHGKPISLTNTNRSKQPTNNRHRSAAGNAISPRELNSIQSSGPARDIRIQSGPFNNTGPARLQAEGRPNSFSLANVRHHGPNPAVIGGPMNSNNRNIGAINGSRIVRRP